ncbi:TlpA disulfide reductase family protein [uncultured Winogradskyella sp.]|uniref:TlpA family protein disulfide reductase n=1 Tax=uncultured Winogradskyella sp. TaxID=395353 RepID=UPI00260E0729|nr:TlpA disulfide reductase family protein [uncultured Winogradskyella sp.]
MKIKKLKRANIIFLVIIALLIIPQTRQPIQIALHKVLSYFSSTSLIEDSERITLDNYDWKLRLDSQNIYDFNDAKGQVVFINFWATWCPPCIVEMPSLQSLYDDYNDKVVFLFITSDDFETVNKFKTKNDFNFEVSQALNEIPKELETRSIPRTFVINKSGKIVIDESGALDWNSETVRSQLDVLLSE